MRREDAAGCAFVMLSAVVGAFGAPIATQAAIGAPWLVCFLTMPFGAWFGMIGGCFLWSRVVIK